MTPYRAVLGRASGDVSVTVVDHVLVKDIVKAICVGDNGNVYVKAVDFLMYATVNPDVEEKSNPDIEFEVGPDFVGNGAEIEGLTQPFIERADFNAPEGYEFTKVSPVCRT